MFVPPDPSSTPSRPEEPASSRLGQKAAGDDEAISTGEGPGQLLGHLLGEATNVVGGSVAGGVAGGIGGAGQALGGAASRTASAVAAGAQAVAGTGIAGAQAVGRGIAALASKLVQTVIGEAPDSAATSLSSALASILGALAPPGQPAAAANDKVVGVDVHIVMVPAPPAPPVPTPLPHPFMGKLDDGLSSDVQIGGQAAATVDSVAHTFPPLHLPTPPGTAFQNPPANQGKVFMGSMTVLIDGKPAARMGDIVKTCNDPTDMPVSTIMSGNPMVLIGGPPSTSGSGASGASGTLASVTLDEDEGDKAGATTGSYGTGTSTIKDDHFWECTVVDSAGQPVGNVPYEVLLPNTKRETGTLPGSGKYHKDSLPAGSGTLRLRGLYAARWNPDAAADGDTVKMHVDCAAFPDGTAVMFKVYREFRESASEVLHQASGRVKNGVAEADFKAQIDPQKDAGCRPRFVFHAILAPHVAVSTPLVLTDQLKIRVEDSKGKPRGAQSVFARDAEGEISDTYTDVKGEATLRGLAVGPVAISLYMGSLEAPGAPPQPQPRPDKLYVVQQGDWLSRIAGLNGFDSFDPIYNYARNQKLKQLRPNPNELYPGDEIWIPGGRREVTVPSYAVQPKTWKLVAGSGPQEELNIIVRDSENKPLRNADYVLQLGGYAKSGTTDGDGRLKEKLYVEMLDMAKLTLTVNGQTFPIKIGHLDPYNTLTGAQSRLKNLGYYDGEVDGEMSADLRASLYKFQKDKGLDADGLPNDATLQKLDQVYKGTV